MPDQSRYRNVYYLGARILEARELNKMQQIERQVDDSNLPSAFEMNAIYREGATFNVTTNIANLTVTLSATDGTKPMLVFVRGQWEILKPTEAPAVTLSPSGSPPAANLYLNYAVNIIDSSQDPALVDSNTGNPTAQMGELVLSVSGADTSAVPLSGSQFEKNQSPIVLFSFLQNGATVTPQALDNVNSQAQADASHSGLVRLTTSTSSGLGVADDDHRLSDSRAPSPHSVVDASVRIPLQDGNNVNADGTPRYDLTLDPGGISAAKVILQSGTQLVSDAIGWVKSQISGILATLNNHIGQPIGLSNTHPFPTAPQVGAAPFSHVGQPLGLATSHPATVAANTGGFRLNRDSTVVPSASDPAFAVFEGSTVKASLTHDGNAYSALAAAFQAHPLQESGDPTLASGPLGLVSTLAAVLSQHVNKTSHKNPHGLAPSDIGAATTSYVDAQDAATYNNGVAYTNSQVPHLTIRVVATGDSTIGGTFLILTFAPNGGTPHYLAFGMGNFNTGPGIYAAVPLPAGFVDTQAIVHASLGGVGANGPGSISSFNVQQSGISLNAWCTRLTGDGTQTMVACNLSWTCFAWV